ncbi:uncharacterized protein [Oryctolagus cuniculus]|uniref:uncharacterized protein isoform X3 n=1 Tax=Oryctolagus cuniculus TaxID=9986 RepID=UPI00387905D8
MARASSRPAQAGGRRGRGSRRSSRTGGKGPPKATCLSPAGAAGDTRGSPGWRPRPPGVPCCSPQPARRAPAPAPEGSICHRERTNPFFFLDYLQCTDHGSKRRWNRCLLILPELMNTLPRVPSGDCRTLGFKAKVV